MARTTVSETIQRVRRQLSSSYRNEINVLTTTMDASVTAVVCDYTLPAGVRIGANITIDIETMRVMAFDAVSKTITVLRGFEDSVAAAHTSGAEIHINPRFPLSDIFDALIDELLSWGPALYKVVQYEAAVADEAETIELDSTMVACYGIIDVLRNRTIDDSTVWPRVNFRFQRQLAAWTGASTTGLLIRFLEPIIAGQVVILAAMPFVTASSSVTEATDLVSGLGLAESQLDVLTQGIKLRLMNDNWAGRLGRTVQDDTRRAEETPADAGQQAMQVQIAIYRSRKQEEIQKLRGLYPIRYT